MWLAEETTILVAESARKECHSLFVFSLKISFLLVWYEIKAVGDIAMEAIAPQKSNIMLECNRAREAYRSSKRLKGIEEINKKKIDTGWDSTYRRGS